MEMQRQQSIMQMQQQQQTMLLQQQQTQASLYQQQRQAQQNYNLQIQQANNNTLNAYNQQKAAAELEARNAMQRNEIERQNYQDSKESTDKQMRLNNEAANRVYVAEQVKLSEAAKKAAFARQTALAKSIGNEGRILASGRTGQSIGLLVNDAERQAGFEEAQANATFESQIDASAVAMEGAFIQSRGANEQALASLGMAPQDPILPSMPNIPVFLEPEAFS